MTSLILGVLASFLFIGTCAKAALPHPLMLDGNGKPILEPSRTLCGTDKMVPMTDETSEIQEMGRPVGIHKVTLSGGVGMCTGTMISKDLFITAQHCEGDCSGITVTFGYLKNRDETFHCKEIVEKGDGSIENDYMIMRLEGNPGVNWGWFSVSDKAVAAGDQLMMIHHPGGEPMKVSYNQCLAFNQDANFLEHRCDTQPGSSGSAILSPDLDNPDNTRIVGIHTLGGCSDDPASFNKGPAMRHLVTVSPTLKQLAQEENISPY